MPNQPSIIRDSSDRAARSDAAFICAFCSSVSFGASPWIGPPGPMRITIAPGAAKPRIDVLSFGPDTDVATIRRQPVDDIADLPELPPGHSIQWVNVVGLGDARTLQAIGQRFHIHPLTLEDIANSVQRPKVEPYDGYLLIITRAPIGHNGDANNGNDALVAEQISICVGPDFVLTFQEQNDDIFDAVRERLKEGTQIRAQGADYLAYAILDAAIDAFFPWLERAGEEVDALEAKVIARPDISQIAQIHRLKRNLLTARRAIWPQREMLNALIRDETPFISQRTRLFLRDCYDHSIQLIDMIETYREVASGLVDILLSSQSNRMNEIMKVLTVIATIFIPLSFIASVYGMNFDTRSPWNMPELHWRFGYVITLGGMAAIALGMLLWFWRKGWLTPTRKTKAHHHKHPKRTTRPPD